MAKSKTLKMFRRAMSRYAFYFFSWVFKWVPVSILDFLIQTLLSMAYVLIIRNRRIAEESIEFALGNERGVKERKKIVRRCFLNLGRGASELLYGMAKPSKINNMVEVVGRQRLDAAIAKGKGVIALTAHFGNFPLLMLYFASQKIQTSCIIRPNRDEKFEQYLFKKRAKYGLKTVYALPRKKCITGALKALNNKDLLFIMMDQNLEGGGGVFIDFFGRRASTATGPVVFAKRSGAVILPMFIVRQGAYRHKIFIEEPYELLEKGSEEATFRYNMQEMTKQIEQYVRQYPSEWAWMHRRWKTHPGETKIRV